MNADSPGSARHDRRSRREHSAVSRRQAVTDLVGAGDTHSQAQLIRGMRARGFRVTQATLSRDLKALGIGKVPAEGSAYVYKLPSPPRDGLDARRLRLEIEAFVQEAKVVGNLVLVRTPPGNGNGVARSLDLLGWPEVEGTLAGDDTILVVTRSRRLAERFRRRLADTAGRRLK